MFFRLRQADQNRSSVHNEIKKSICTLILEINKKGKMLMNQLEVWQCILDIYNKTPWYISFTTCCRLRFAVLLNPLEHYLLACSVDCFTLRPRAHALKLFEYCRCSFIHVFQAVTKDHESVLRKQQEDIGYLSRHLDHVINFTKWATARSGGTAFLYCKRLVRPVWSFTRSEVSHHHNLVFFSKLKLDTVC